MVRLSDYDYDLPEDRIAQRPLADRSSSKLLHLDIETKAIQHRQFGDVPSLFREGDLLVVNETRVTAIRLHGQKSTGAAVEALLLRETAPNTFLAVAKPGKRLGIGARIEFPEGLSATVEGADGMLRTLRFEADANLADKLAAIGSVPLPPYIHEPLGDPERYQTVYSGPGGSAAAPTAGLHFTREILDELREMGVVVASVRLDVGLDTFRPMEAEDVSQHPIHGEVCAVSRETADAVATCKGRVIAVGTTAVRTLESFAVGPRLLEPGEKQTKLFILPGYRFQVVNGMFTNFHMPRTTMLLMLSALAGRDPVMRAYEEALHFHYRFLSFGDSMLLL